MNIGGNSKGVAGRLSNFTARKFIFDGVECNSMEGLLQSFKFENPVIQEHICTLVGKEAKKRGQKRNRAWKSVQTLWWKGKAYPRKSDEYQKLITRAYDALATNEKFCKDLIQTRNAHFTHSIGKSKEADTVLTEGEFCRQLLRIRTRLQKISQYS
jgi:hypothetical protein